MGKTVALSGKKRKLTHVIEPETNILARTQVPHSVGENFVSCLFRKLSRQERTFLSPQLTTILTSIVDTR